MRANSRARRRGAAMRLTSVRATNVIGANKNKKTQCTIVQGGFHAGAQSRTPARWGVGRSGGAGHGGFRRGSGKENQDRRDLRPDRPARRRRLGAAIYRRQDHARPLRQDRRRGLQGRGGLCRRPEQARYRHQRGGAPAGAGKGRHADGLLLVGAMRAGVRPRRPDEEVHVDHHLHFVRRVRRQELQIRLPSAGQPATSTA